jgi:lipopolysaccharide biosynthesis protein
VVAVLRDEARRAAVAAITATRIVVPVGHLLALGDERDPQVGSTTTWSTRADLGRHLAVLAHWDAQGRFAEPARQTARALRDAGFEVVVVSTVTTEHSTFVVDVGTDAIAVLTRPNVGFDFGSWAAGLDLLRGAGARPERLVLLNSSMYGPVSPVGPMLDRLYATGADVMGATESREFRPHLQSWFLAFSQRAWDSERFVDYWRRIRPATDKWGTIFAHEQRWADDLALPGARPAVAVSARTLGTRRNPLTFTWREVLLADVPFVKRSLFFDNFDRIDLTGWREFLVENAPGFDVGIIDRDVARLRDDAT